ncbi:MAG: hypothetical protein ACPGYV_06460 [Phycisphaeraceae bacterium]
MRTIAAPLLLLLAFSFTATSHADEPLPLPGDDTATIVIENPPPSGAEPLVQRLKQVLKPTQKVKILPAPDRRTVRLEVTDVRDLRALANKIPFGQLESIDQRTRTITVDYED